MGPTNSTKRGKPNQNPTPTSLQLQPQLQLHQHPTNSTKRGKPNQNPTPTSLQLQPQLHQHPTNSTKRGRPSQSQTLTNPQPQLRLQHHPTRDRRETPPSVRHQSQPVEASATYQALPSASITIRAAVAATIPMTAQPPSLFNVIFLLVPSLVGRHSVSEDMCAIDIF